MITSNNESIVLGGGCFWCLDASFRLIKGVDGVVSGYAGGNEPNPTYLQVASGATGHAEVVRVAFDQKEIPLESILDVFWAIHDPTTPNRQGNDVGPQYRSIILYSTELQKTVAQTSKRNIAQYWNAPIVTEIRPLDTFYPTEDYHQNYFAKNPSQAYCQAVINPKLIKLREKYQELLA